LGWFFSEKFSYARQNFKFSLAFFFLQHLSNFLVQISFRVLFFEHLIVLSLFVLFKFHSVDQFSQFCKIFFVDKWLRVFKHLFDHNYCRFLLRDSLCFRKFLSLSLEGSCEERFWLLKGCRRTIWRVKLLVDGGFTIVLVLGQSFWVFLYDVQKSLSTKTSLRSNLSRSQMATINIFDQILNMFGFLNKNECITSG
jgi:hypothetical protein